MTALISRVAALIVGVVALAGTADAQLRQATESQVKAAYLYQFGGFVEWPPQAFADADAPFAIGVLGTDAVAEELLRIAATRSVQGRRMEVRKLEQVASLEGLQVVFVGRSADALSRVVKAAREMPILLVTDFEHGLPPGSMINFVAIGNRIRFDVALGPANRSRLRISSRLLGVARQVVKSSG